jgi:hypothetical protein
VLVSRRPGAAGEPARRPDGVTCCDVITALGALGEGGEFTHATLRAFVRRHVLGAETGSEA